MSSANSKRVAIYLRQSQDRTGEGLGIDRQREEVRALVRSRGWTVVDEFVDNDVSALARKPRPQFTEMMRRADAGEFDVIVARHMDRLLRRLSELESVLERCATSGAAIVTSSDGVDTSSDGGRLIARILSSVAQGEVERKSARQRSAAQQAARQGRWVGGRRPFGYEPDGVTIREPEAELIRTGYKALLAGESVAEIARQWAASGIPTAQSKEWSRSAVRDILTNPRNAGLRRHRNAEDRPMTRKNPELGIIGAAEWSGIVDESTWRAAVRVFSDPSRRRAPIGGKGLLTGIALCGVCGEAVHRGGATHGNRVYRCRTGRHVSRKADPIDDYVSKVALERLKRADAAQLWTAEQPNASELMGEADTLRRRLDDLAVDYADGVMTRAQFRTANDRVTQRLAMLEEQIAAAGSSSPLAIVASTDIDHTWRELSTARRRAIIHALLVARIGLVGAGTRAFDPTSVEIEWRQQAI